MTTENSIGTPEQLRDPDYTPPLGQAIPLGIQHVLAMFASNVTPAFIIAGVAGLALPDKIFLIQMAMIFAGIATLIQTVGLGPIGARLPVVQGTSFAFIPVMIPIAKTAGMGALFGAAVIGGVFHFFLGTIIGKIRRFLPPIVTGLVVLTIGLSLLPIGIQYAAGGVPLMGKPEFGGANHWFLASVVIVVTLGVKFFFKGFMSAAAVLVGLVAGYLVAIPMGMANFSRIGGAGWFTMPDFMHFGFEINAAAIIGMCLMAVISAIETVGDISGITKGGAGREATDKEIGGGTMAEITQLYFERRRVIAAFALEDAAGAGQRVHGRRAGHRHRRFVWRIPQHIVQPELRTGFHDRRHEPPCGDLRGDLPDHCRVDPESRRRDCRHAHRRSGRWCDRHVRHGRQCGSSHAGRRQDEPPQHDHHCRFAVLRVGPESGTRSRTASFANHENADDHGAAAGSVPGHRPEYFPPGRS